jgi:nitroreductase
MIRAGASLLPGMQTIDTNPTLDLLSSRASVRSFTDEPVPDSVLHPALEAARRAPTSSNWQTYSIVVVRDQEKKARLAELAGGQRHVAESQVFLAFVADFHRVRRGAELHDVEPARGLEFTLTPIVDAAIVGEATQVALESVGLGAVMVGGMRAHATEVADVLGLPHEAFVVYGMSVGWPAGDPTAGGLKPRLPSHLVIHEDTYSDAGLEEAIAAYDAELAEWYEARGRNLSTSAWTGPVARGSAALRYASLRTELEGLGFRFD